MNEAIVHSVLQAVVECGVTDFVICPGGRNAPFVDVLRSECLLKTYYWPEERSAAFFALGLARRHNKPVAVIVTSGTAAGELLPAAMEAYYAGIPLLLITADRPLRFRGSGAPQTAEQVGLFGPYAPFSRDIHSSIDFNLSHWTQQSPAHLNVCLEEPQGQAAYSGKKLNIVSKKLCKKEVNLNPAKNILNNFLLQVERPLVIVSTLPLYAKEQVLNFLLKLKAPVFLEGISDISEDSCIQSLRIRNSENILEFAKKSHYEIDGVLRIGGIPTNRVWRDIENLGNQINVCSLSEMSFSGLSWSSNVACVDIGDFLNDYHPERSFDLSSAQEWLKNDSAFLEEVKKIYHEEPLAEPSLMYSLAKALPENSHVYLGNSLPIREWDLAAEVPDKNLQITASRGLNGIDGQIATFLGLCRPETENWAILGDLTTLYDMAGFWGLSSLGALHASVVIINNGGGKIFERMFPHPEMLNKHGLSFGPLADMWGLTYVCWEKGIHTLNDKNRFLIEIVPDDVSTKRFWKKIGILKSTFLLNNSPTYSVTQ